MDVDDYEDILEWSWAYDEVMYEDGAKIEALASISFQNSGMCLYYSMRDALKSCKNVFELSCEERDASYFSEFGEDISVQQLMDAVPKCPSSLHQLFEYAQKTGVTTVRCYNDVACQIPNELLKDITGCPKVQINEWKIFTRFGGFTKEKVMNIAREMEEYGPASGYFTCASNLEKDLPSQFIFKPEENVSTKADDADDADDTDDTEDAEDAEDAEDTEVAEDTEEAGDGDGLIRYRTHAVLLTGFGRARKKSSGKVSYYWIIQNNWGDFCPVARIPVRLFVEIHTLKFKNAVEITASRQLEVQAEYKAVREQVFRDYTPH